MNYGAEPADQVVRYTLEGTEFALKISGTAAKNFAVFALAVLRDQKKTHGKTKLVRLLREGKPLKFFSVPTDQMRDFAKAAKSHGLLYVPIRDRSDPDNIEIAVWAEDAAKVNRVIDKLQLDVVDTGEAELVADVQKGQSQPVPEKETIETEHGAVSFAVGESEEQFNMDFTPAPKQSDLETTALGRKNPSEPSSPNKGPLPDTPSPRADKIRANGQRPSVRRELGDIRVFLRQRDDARAQLPRMPVKIKRIFQDDAIRLAVEYHERGWLIWINELLILCGCAIISKAHPYQPQSHGSQNRFTIPAIISLVSIVMTGRLQNGYYQGEINGAFLLYFAAVLLFSDVMTFVLIVWNEKDERLKGENLTLTARARTQAESIEALSASYAAQRKLTHDFNAHLATLSSYLENRQIKDAQDYIATLREHQTDRILIANTHNSTIDALLNQKAQVAKKNNIDIRFKVNDLSGTKVAPMDLVIIIGNLLDNAIEACLKLPAGEREIYAQLLLEGTLFLSFRNTSPPVEIVNGYIATTKKPPDLHGFGLQNVKTALKKYDSFYDMAYEDGYFAFTIEMENDLPSATKNSFFAT